MIAFVRSSSSGCTRATNASRLPPNVPHLEAVDAVELVGPRDGVGPDVPLEAADVGGSLRFRQARFAQRQPPRRRAAVHGVEGGADAADHRPVPGAQRIDDDRVPASPVLVVERLPLARQRHQVVRDARIGGVPRAEEVVDAGADDVAGAQARDVDEPARRIGEPQRPIDRPHGPRMLAEHQPQGAVAFAPIGDRVLQRAIEPRVVDGQRDEPRDRLGRDEIRLRVGGATLPRRQRDDADDAIPSHQRREHRRAQTDRPHGEAVALAHGAGGEGVLRDLRDQQRVAGSQDAAARLW